MKYTESPTETIPSSITDADHRDQPSSFSWSTLEKFRSWKDPPILLQGAQGSLRSIIVEPNLIFIPTSKLDQSIPSMVKFSPAVPTPIGCPSSRS